MNPIFVLRKAARSRSLLSGGGEGVVKDLSRCGAVESSQKVEEGGLSRARGAGENGKGARVEVEVDGPKDLDCPSSPNVGSGEGAGRDVKARPPHSYLRASTGLSRAAWREG